MNLESIRRDFPLLQQSVGGKPLIYLDNAASTQVPTCVLERFSAHYLREHANIYRGSHHLSQLSSSQVDAVREKTAGYIGAARPESVVFTSGATASINIAAQAYLQARLRPGDNVVVTEMEHHSNFLVWQELCRRAGADLRVAPHKNGELDAAALASMVDDRTRLVAVCAVSNVLGTVNDVEYLARTVHSRGAVILVDAAQGIRHRKWNMEAGDFDFFCFSGHKIMSSTGIGVLYVNPRLFSSLSPCFFGGGMVTYASPESSSFSSMPALLEAGTPNISGILALGESLDYLQRLGDELYQREDMLTAHLESVLRSVPGVNVLGRPAKRSSLVSVTAEGLSCADLAAYMDMQGVALRAGTQCAQVLLRSMGLSSVLRFSTAFYNTVDELDRAAEYLESTIKRLERRVRQ